MYFKQDNFKWLIVTYRYGNSFAAFRKFTFSSNGFIFVRFSPQSKYVSPVWPTSVQLGTHSVTAFGPPTTDPLATTTSRSTTKTPACIICDTITRHAQPFTSSLLKRSSERDQTTNTPFSATASRYCTKISSYKDSDSFISAIHLLSFDFAVNSFSSSERDSLQGSTSEFFLSFFKFNSIESNHGLAILPFLSSNPPSGFFWVHRMQCLSLSIQSFRNGE